MSQSQSKNEVSYNEITKIITHGGPAHRDEFLGCCLVLSKFPNVPIYRRDPTKEELADPTCAVVDVGRDFNPSLHNYDHHQFSRDSAPACALSLVLEHSHLFDGDLVGEDEGMWSGGDPSYPEENQPYYAPHLTIAQTAERMWPWYFTTKQLDCWGPYATMALKMAMAAEKSGTTLFNPDIRDSKWPSPFHVAHDRAKADGPNLWREVGLPLQSPLEGFVLFAFGAYNELGHLDGVLTEIARLRGFMTNLGEHLIHSLKEAKERNSLLDQACTSVRVKGLQVLMVRPALVDGTMRPTFQLENWIERNWSDPSLRPAITITADDRGPGLCLFRREDHPRVNFTRVKDRPGVIFAHPGGFVAKLHKNVDPWPLVEASIE